MAETYKQFDKNPIVDTSDIVIKGFKVRVREVALGIACLVCLLVIIILAALLAGAQHDHSDDSASASAQTGGGCYNDSCFSPSCLKAAAYVTELVNTSVKPCDDFHAFACGQFAKMNPLDVDENELTTSLVIYYKNQDRIHRLLEKPSKNYNKPENYETKLKDFFASCNDHYLKMQQQGTPFIDQVLRKVGWWGLQGDAGWSSSTYNFQDNLQKVHVEFWTDAFFSFSIGEDWLDWNKPAIHVQLAGLGTPYGSYEEIFGNRYYTPTEELEKYKKFIRTVGKLLLRDAALNLTEQETKYRVDTFVADTIYVEKELATVKEFSQPMYDPESDSGRMTLTQLNANSAGAIDWVQFFGHMFDEAPVTPSTEIVVYEKAYIIKFQEWIQNLPAQNKSRILNNYLTWRVTMNYVQDLSWDYVHANREMYVDLTGVAQFLGTWRYCVNKISWDFEEGLSALFVQDHFADANKKTAREITDYVKQALVEHLSDSMHWMSSETRRTATLKINETLIKLGYPDYMMNQNTLDQIYATLKVDKDDYFGNLMAMNKYMKNYINKRYINFADRTVWLYSTYTFIAQYWNPWKELIVPAGLLQFPIYDHTSPRFMNFGSMGSIIGKQLTHAVDEIGNYYALNGSHYGEWWSVGSKKRYTTVRNCIVDAYKNITMGPFTLPVYDGGDPIVYPAIKVDASYYAPLALGESSGVSLAFKAYQDWVNATGGEKMMAGQMFTNEQSFFVSYAQTFCSNRTPYSALQQAWRGRTLPENIRVNSALAQLKEFQKAFQCPANSKMVAPKRCNLY